MENAGFVHANNATYGETSPIIIAKEWNSLMLILVYSGISFTGCIATGFVITSIFIRQKLCRPGNAYLGNFALSDMVDCGIVIPITIVVLVSSSGDNYLTCQMQVFFQRLSQAFKYIISMFIAHDSEKRLTLSLETYRLLHTKSTVTEITLFSWAVAIIYAGIATYTELGPGYCDRTHQGNTDFQIGSFVFIYAFPTLVVIYFHIYIIGASRNHFKLHKLRRPPIMNREWTLAYINMANFYTLVASSVPFAIVNFFLWNQVNDRNFYILGWLGILRSCLYNLTYGLGNVEFRRGFAYAFNYCFLRSTVVHRGRNNWETRRTFTNTGVRCHVMHPRGAVESSEPVETL